MTEPKQEKQKNFSGSMSVDEFVRAFVLTQAQIDSLYRMREQGKLF